MMRMKLSICIATRNRGAFIGETLRSILPQCGEAVEVVVLDGASSDDTEQVVRGLAAAFPVLRYFRQAVNGGVDRDYDAAVGYARGEYCWLMSDDDLVKPGAVGAVLRAIDRGASLIVVNSELRNFDFSELLDHSRLRLAADRTYAPEQFESLFEDVSGYLGYIGAVVIRRDIWQSRRREPYFGSNFIHVGVIFQQRLPGETVVLNEPLISIRFGNTQWRPREFEIRMIRWTELIWSLDGISERVKARNYRSEPWRSLKSLLFYRAKGTYDLGDYGRLIRPRLASRWDRAKAAGVACLPGAIANLLGLVVCRTGYRDSNVHLLDMQASRFYYKNWFRADAG